MRVMTMLKIGVCALPLLWAGVSNAQGMQQGQQPMNQQQMPMPGTQPQGQMGTQPQGQMGTQQGQMGTQQGQMGTQQGQMGQVGALTPQQFVNKAAAANLLEIKLGRLAADKGSTQQVRSFGQKMIDDHTKVNDQLRKIAEKNKLTMPTTLPPEKQDVYDHLSSLTGRQFDDAYMNQEMQDHQQAVSLFQQEASSGTNPEIASFANRTLPALKQHQDMATRGSHKM